MRVEQKIFNEWIETILINSSENKAVITNVKLWAENWKKEMENALTDIEKGVVVPKGTVCEFCKEVPTKEEGTLCSDCLINIQNC